MIFSGLCFYTEFERGFSIHLSGSGLTSVEKDRDVKSLFE